MNAKKEINVNLIKTTNDSFPLIRVIYFDSEDHPQTGVMIVDTGSSSSSLFGDMAEILPPESRIEGKTARTQSIGDKIIQLDIYDFPFWLGGIFIREEFSMINHIAVDFHYGKVIGLIGIDILRKYGLALDFTNHTLSTSHISPEDINASTCSYVFPLDIGISTYGVPIIPVVGKEKMYAALLDTGSPYSAFPEHIIKREKYPCEYLDEYDEITYATCIEREQLAHLQFSIMGLDEDIEGPLKQYDREEKILITKHPHFIERKVNNSAEGEERTHTVDMLLGCQFIAREGWTLDFAHYLAYKLRETA